MRAGQGWWLEIPADSSPQSLLFFRTLDWPFVSGVQSQRVLLPALLGTLLDDGR